MRRALLLSPLLALLVAAQVQAVTPGEQLPDRAQEARARRISAELRCLVCQNQSIDDSDAPLAKDLRRLVRERILAGDNDAAIRGFLVARYGDFVLLKPPVSMKTMVLWSLPALALLFGAGAALRLFRRRDDQRGEAAEMGVVEMGVGGAGALTAAEHDELQALIDRHAAEKGDITKGS